MKPRLRSKHRKTLQGIFERPIRANIPWADLKVCWSPAERRSLKGEVPEYALSSMMYGLCSIAHIRGKKLTEAQWLPCVVS